MANASKATTLPDEITVVTWNANCLNPDPQAAADKIFGLQPSWSILCLQEVPDDLERILHERICELYSARESIREMPDGSRRNTHTVILVRKPLKIVASEIISFPAPAEPGLRERMLAFLLTPFGKNQGRPIDSNFIYVDVSDGQRVFRVFSTYLAWANIEHRNRSWDKICRTLSKSYPNRNIVCGDLNIFNTMRGAILNWFLGSKVSEVILPWKHRQDMEERFTRFGLQNPLAHDPTNKSIAGNMQLDHVLIPIRNTVVCAGTAKFDKHGGFGGSDHVPAYVTFRFKD